MQSDQLFKGTVFDSNPIHFLANSVNIYSQPASCQFCVRAENDPVLMHSPVSVFKETKKVARTEPYNSVPANH